VQGRINGDYNPLKIPSCNKKNTGENNRRDRREMAVFVIS
jgi:hypothetical protein